MGYFKDTLKGVSWIGGLRGLTRLIAFVRIAILARLLSPAEFGLFGIASLILAFLEIITETGINVFLIQEDSEIEEYVNSAWIVSILRGLLISLLLLALSSPMANFFNSSDATKLIVLLSLIPFLRGFINPAIVRFQKELEFNKEFVIRSLVFAFDAIVAITLGYYLRGAEALVFGMVAGVILELILSWYLIKPRPRLIFEKEKVKKVLSRGKWVTLAGIFDYFFNHADDIVVGKLLDIFSLGLYQVAYKISTLPITEVADVFNKVTFPVFVNIRYDLDRLKRAYLKTTLTVSLITIPFGLFLFFFPREVILLILGPNWLGIDEVLRALAIFGVVRAITGPSLSLYLSLKKQEYVTGYTFLSTLGLAVSVIPLVRTYKILGAAIAANIGLFVSLPLMAYYSAKILRSK